MVLVLSGGASGFLLTNDYRPQWVKREPGARLGPRLGWLVRRGVALWVVDYSSGSMTTSTLLPAARMWRAKAAMVSGVCALTICS